MKSSNNPERASNNQRRRRRLLVKLAAEQDNLCFYCDQLLEFPDPEKRYTNEERNGVNIASFDHVVPRSKNGREGSNLVIAHRHCNSQRNIQELDDEQTAKLERLNERRKHLFTAESGKTAPDTFGIISVASIALAEKVDEPDITQRMRSKICSFCQKYTGYIRSLRSMRDSTKWLYISDLILKDNLAKLEASDMPHQTYISSILYSVRLNDLRKRFGAGGFDQLDYDPKDYPDDT